jgi:hypothetical protein
MLNEAYNAYNYLKKEMETSRFEKTLGESLAYPVIEEDTTLDKLRAVLKQKETQWKLETKSGRWW